MRIIAGLYKGRPIVFPGHIRPTKDIVRKAIFDTLASVIEGQRVLDLFAGCGSLGLEALSRGASGAWFIESDRKCSLLIAKNLEKILKWSQDAGDIRVYTNDVFRAMDILGKRGEVFDVIFLDPPYRTDLAKKALQTLAAGAILPPHGFLIIEHHRLDDLGDVPQGLAAVKKLAHGDVRVTIFEKE